MRATERARQLAAGSLLSGFREVENRGRNQKLRLDDSCAMPFDDLKTK
jgi:hypothetical protein